MGCDGLSPCKTCSNRNKHCLYGGSQNVLDTDSPNKRRKTETAFVIPSSPVDDKEPPKYVFNVQQPQTSDWDVLFTQEITTPNLPNWTESRPQSSMDQVKQQIGQKEQPKSEYGTAELSSEVPRASVVVAQDEEADVYNYTRMLQDPTGRLLYLGDSASLSYLQLVRIVVEGVAGPSPFTQDPQRHRIVENTILLPTNTRLTTLLPDKATARILLDAYLINTNGLVEVFSQKKIVESLEKCYEKPLDVDSSWLCLLHLTFAIGLVMACPNTGTEEEKVIQRLRSESVDRAEIFYLNAKQLGGPLRGFEDGDFWSIQALTLMSIYMLSISKRNAAYAYHGMAVRSAFALGLHRAETHCIFDQEEQSVRRNLWRSLFILDRFLATSLGRPTAIRECDCSGDILETAEYHTSQPDANEEYTKSAGLKVSVRSCHVIGIVLEKVYSCRKVSTGLAQEIANECKSCPKMMEPTLHWRQARSAKPSQGVAILHVNLFYCHSVILLTRPFLLYLMKKKHEDTGNGSEMKCCRAKMKQFAESCVVASCHSIALVQVALEGGYLSRRNPFVIYFMFTAALVVLSNEFSFLYSNSLSKICVRHAIDIMRWCSESDPHAKRLLVILSAFRDVVEKHHDKNPGQLPTYPSQGSGTAPSSPNTTSSNVSPTQKNVYPTSLSQRKPSTSSNQPLSFAINKSAISLANPQPPYTPPYFTNSITNSPTLISFAAHPRTISSPNSLASNSTLHKGCRSSTPGHFPLSIGQPQSPINTPVQLHYQKSFDLCLNPSRSSNTHTTYPEVNTTIPSQRDDTLELGHWWSKVPHGARNTDSAPSLVSETVGVGNIPGSRRRESVLHYGDAMGWEGQGNGRERGGGTVLGDIMRVI
ncbi:hypothetical protein HYFRA_00007216 [Hymenoscyphus fraxineus]|uniref:Xylanolytic transcriptional activator regulatory domain-containing protein n=1 Tax=Hymenoscyphus fraxineus TaxID=746836 RepID=A0A9N9KZY6_9HELO|nr:hypothetical protein HYFRA_00007216 [Hymenoscyphus fraxineus]